MDQADPTPNERIVSEADIPCTLIYTAAECAADPQFRQRGMVREVDDPLFGQVLHAGVVPHVPDNPGVIRWPGAAWRPYRRGHA